MSCVCNWTSIFRGNDSKVPSVEKYRQDNLDRTSHESDDDDDDDKVRKYHHRLPETIDELKAFGDTLETGDVLIMHCTHSFGKLAQLATKSPWDHVAMVVKCNAENVQDRLKLINAKPQPPSSTIHPWPKPGSSSDYETTEVLEAMAGGSFTYPFSSHVIARGSFCKYIAVRRLRNIHGEPLDKERQRKIEHFVQEFWGRPYEKGSKGLWEIIRPILNFRKLNPHLKRDKSQEALEEVFCSELIAEAYMSCGLLPDDTLNSNEILPSMFGPNNDVDRYLKMMHDSNRHSYRLGDVEVFKAPCTPLNTCIIETRKRLREERQKQIAGEIKNGNCDDDTANTILASASSEEKKGLIQIDI